MNPRRRRRNRQRRLDRAFVLRSNYTLDAWARGRVRVIRFKPARLAALRMALYTATGDHDQAMRDLGVVVGGFDLEHEAIGRLR